MSIPLRSNYFYLQLVLLSLIPFNGMYSQCCQLFQYENHKKDLSPGFSLSLTLTAHYFSSFAQAVCTVPLLHWTFSLKPHTGYSRHTAFVFYEMTMQSADSRNIRFRASISFKGFGFWILKVYFARSSSLSG